MRASYGSSPVARFSRDLSDLSWLYIIEGIALVVIGILIVIFPDLLAIMVAAFLILGGALTIAAGLRVRKARKSFEEMGRLLWE